MPSALLINPAYNYPLVKKEKFILKLCITGGAGFIGSNLARRLLKEPIDVKIVDNLSTGKIGNISDVKDSVEFEDFSILDTKKLSNAFKGCDTVIHLAAKTTTTGSMNNEKETLKTNIEGTKSTMEACLSAGVKKVVFASSAAVYAESKTPVKESHPIDPRTPYGASKLEAERIIQEFGKKHGIKFCILRLFNVYGPRQPFDSLESAVIPKFISLAKKNKKLPIRGDGTQTRDFIYVSDVCAALRNAAAIEKCEGFVINIGSGKSTTILELADVVKRITKSKSTPKFVPSEDEICHSCADIGLSKRLLGMERFTSLEEGIKKTAEWIDGV